MTKIHTSDIKIPKHNSQYINKKYDNWLIKLFIAPTNKLRLIYNKIWNNQEKYSNIINYIFHRYVDAKNPIEVIRRIQHNIEIKPVCPICGEENIFNSKPGAKSLFSKYCSRKCSAKATKNFKYIDREKIYKTKLERYGSIGYNNREKAQQTNLEKYGSKNNSEKTKQTKLEKYGDPYYRNPEKYKETLLEKYGVTSTFKIPELIEKIKETNVERYGVDNPFKSTEIRQQIFETNKEKYGNRSPLKNKEVLQKIKETNIERYGVDNVFKSLKIKDKIAETLIEKYGVNSWSKTEEGKNFLSETNKEIWENKSFGELSKIKEKIKQTNLEKYGAKSWTESEIGKQALSIMLKSPEVQQKIYETKKKNGTFNTSKREQEILTLLKENFDNVGYQYKEDRYPFNCDYYIPSLDLFIEYQGKPDHGKHPYNENNIDDQNILNQWIGDNKDLKQRTGRKRTRYDHMIECWTISDPRKRQVAKENGINLLEIWPDWSDEKILNEIKKFEKIN